MQSGKNGSVRDFVAVGDVDIRAIGADNQILDSEVPVRQILEQLIARTGIPPFMIGLDKGYALEMITAGDVQVEYDRLIDRQLERAAITSISGFAKLYAEASRVLTV